MFRGATRLLARYAWRFALTGRGRLRLAPYQWYSARHTGSGTVSKSRPGTSCRERFSLPPSRVNVGAFADTAHRRIYQTWTRRCELERNRQLPVPKGRSVNQPVVMLSTGVCSFVNRKTELDSPDITELDFLHSRGLCNAFLNSKDLCLHGVGVDQGLVVDGPGSLCSQL